MGHEHVYRVTKENIEQKVLSFDSVHAWEGFDAVVHLAGEPIAERWSEEKLRIQTLGLSLHIVCQLFFQSEKPPKVFISASIRFLRESKR